MIWYKPSVYLKRNDFLRLLKWRGPLNLPPLNFCATLETGGHIQFGNLYSRVYF